MAAKKMIKEKEDWMGMYGCCLSSCGIIHFLGGLGVGFLIVSYFSLPGLIIWGWALVVIAVLGHLMGKTQCKIR